MEKKEIKLNHFNIYTIIAIIALIYFSVKCIQFYFEVGIPKEIWETIIVKKNIFISNEKNKETKLLENLLFLLLAFTPPLLVYLFVKKIYKICNYFLSEEKIIISDEHFYYTRKLAMINFEKFEINLNEIKRITKIPMKIPNRFSTNILALAFYGILRNKKEYKIWNIPAKKFSPSTYFAILKDDVDLYIKELREYLKLEEENIEDNEEIKSLIKRYNFILNKIIEEEKLYLYKDEENFIVNAEEVAIKNLEILKDINFEEMDFYVFYVNYLSKKEYEDKKILVGYSGIDGKEVTMSKLKDDINKIRDDYGVLEIKTTSILKDDINKIRDSKSTFI